jgi:hypothetical protein
MIKKLENPAPELYPFHPDLFRYNGKIFLLNERLECDVEYQDKFYFIKYKPLDISVWSETRDEVEDAFYFSFYSLYENLVLEDDKNLSSKAIALKGKMKKLINKVLDEG